MSFRAATKHDESLFFRWRQAEEARGSTGGWWIGTPTTETRHHAWFRDRLKRVKLLVWSYGSWGEVGIARIDSNGEVAFACPKQWQADLLEDIKSYAITCGCRLKVTVDAGDDAHIAALDQAGFVESPVRFFTYRA